MDFFSITVTLWRRYDYTRLMLEHLSKCLGIEKYLVQIFCEPDCPEVVELASSFDIGCKEKIVHVNPQRLGCTRNILQALTKGFERSDYNIHVEDDILLAPDALVWFEFCRSKFKNDKNIFSVTSYYKDIVDRDKFYSYQIEKWFTVWGWATWGDRFEEIKTHRGFYDDPAISWDVIIARNIFKDRSQAVPFLGRSKNIGAKNGTYCIDPIWHRENQFNDFWAGNPELNVVFDKNQQWERKEATKYPIVKKIFQTWKTRDVPERVFPKHWTNSWLRDYPGWTYNLYTDEDNRNFMKENYPEFLELYDSYDLEIKRADIIRYFRLHKHGGLYVDLDCISIKSLMPILEKHDLVLGIEPKANWFYNCGKQLLSNVVMYSRPGHPFWEMLFDEINREQFKGSNAVEETGPQLVTRVHKKYLTRSNSGYLLNEDEIPWNLTRSQTDPLKMKLVDRKRLDLNVYVIHSNRITWSDQQPDYSQEFSEERKKNLQDSIQYVCTWVYGRMPILVREILENNKRMCEKLGLAYEIFSYEVEAGESAAGKATWLKIDHASRFPNTLCLDWDCQIEHLPWFDSNIPLAAFNFQREIDLWAFYNGNRTDLFKLLNDSFTKNTVFDSYRGFINQEDFQSNFRVLTGMDHKSLQTGRVIKLQ